VPAKSSGRPAKTKTKAKSKSKAGKKRAASESGHPVRLGELTANGIAGMARFAGGRVKIEGSPLLARRLLKLLEI